MNRVLMGGILFAAVHLFCCCILFADELAITTTVYCKDHSLSQVFESCEEVVVLEQKTYVFSVYSKAKQTVMNVKPETLFVARLAAEGEKMLEGEHITVASDRVWNSSGPGFLGLCTIDKVLKGNLLRVSCGRRRNERISRASVYRLRPFSQSAQKSELKLFGTKTD